MSTTLTNINKVFGKFQALYDINIQIHDGEFLAILGPSGCGKTTLLRLLAGFESPTDGTIEADGIELANARKVIPPERRNVGMVFQSFALWPHMDVREHIKFPLQQHRFVAKSLKENPDKRIDEVLKIVELQDFSERMPGELSGGQKQRVSLARAIAANPKLLLMDEPLSNLDAELRVDMRREIQKLHHLTKASIVYVTHDQGEALAMADRIIVMNKGRIEQIGTPEDIYYYPETEFVATFVGKANLFRGKWNGNQFTPDDTDVVWEDYGVSEKLKNKNIYPLRPEQIMLSKKDGAGLSGIVITKQFQGKEYHYTVNVNGKIVIVHMPIQNQFDIGEEVGVWVPVTS